MYINEKSKAHDYKGALRVFVTCASIIPSIIKEYPQASFAVNGAESMDFESDKVEKKANNQRFRIYRTMALNLFGRETFEHIEYSNVSSYLLVNKNYCDSIEDKTQRIKDLFLSKFDLEL